MLPGLGARARVLSPPVDLERPFGATNPVQAELRTLLLRNPIPNLGAEPTSVAAGSRFVPRRPPEAEG